MTESQEYVELNRFISGELSPPESLQLMRRMLQDKELRETFEQLQKVDEVWREQCFADMSCGEAAVLEHGVPVEPRRGQLIEEIIRKTAGATADRPAAGVRSSKSRTFWRRVAPSLAAAAALVIAGLWLASLLPEGGPQYGAFRGPVPLDQERISYLKSVQKTFGNVAVVSSPEGNSGNYEPVDDHADKDVVVRVTVVRHENGVATPWVVDALVPHGRVMELVTETGPAWRPESVRLSVGKNGGEEMAVSIQVKLAADSQVSQTVKVKVAQAERVAEVRAGAVRFEVFVQAEPVSAAGQIL